MKTILKEDHLILVPESGTEEQTVAVWKGVMTGHVLLVGENLGGGLVLRDLGQLADACHEVINVSSRNSDPTVQLLSNFAATPFELDGRPFSSVEAFWQGLKFEDEQERRRVAGLSGAAARRAGEKKGYGTVVTYEGVTIPVGTWAHWELMARACWAKFMQNEEARAALLATGDRPLTHRVRRDSRTIPGVIMADIWMRTRRRLRNPGHGGVDDPL